LTNPDAYAKEFVPKAQATIKAAGAKIVVLGGAGGGAAKPITAIEGTPPKRIDVQQRDSLDGVKAWYNSKGLSRRAGNRKEVRDFRTYAVEGQ
jgi:uncharacterized protein (DUF1330 family)